MTGQLEVFFDGQCPLCRREIEMIRDWDKTNHMIFTDISRAEFDPIAETGRSLEELMREIHARIVHHQESDSDSSSKWFTGVDVFREMYSRVGFKKSVRVSNLPVVSQLLKLSYRMFAAVRFKFAMKRMAGAMNCGDECGWSPEKLTNESNANGVAS